MILSTFLKFIFNYEFISFDFVKDYLFYYYLICAAQHIVKPSPVLFNYPSQSALNSSLKVRKAYKTIQYVVHVIQKS